MTAPGVRSQRVLREMFLAAIGANLASLEPWVTDRLAAILEEDEVAAGERIYSAGDPPDYFYVVGQGRVELIGDDEHVDVVDGPTAFGVVDALAERLHTHTAYAPTALSLLRVPTEAWLGVLEDSFELARVSLGGLVSAVATLEERLWETGRRVDPAPSAPLAPGTWLDIVERVAVFLRTPPLRGAGVQPLSDLALTAEEISFQPGEHLFERDSPSDRVFVIVDGLVEGSREEPSATWTGGAREMVCGTVSFSAKRSQWEARAVTRVRTLAFGIEDWFDLMEENFEMVRATLASLAAEHERLSLALHEARRTQRVSGSHGAAST